MNTVHIVNPVAALFIGAGILASGCDRNKESPVAIEEQSVPATPVIPPGQVGAQDTQQGLVTPPSPEGLVGEQAKPGIDTTIADIMNRPTLYVGRDVTVISEMEEIFTAWAFKLDESQALSGGVDNDLLVIGAIPLTSWNIDKNWKNQKVVVTGTVRILQAEDFEREYGRGVDDLLFRRYEGKPVVIAREVKKAG